MGVLLFVAYLISLIVTPYFGLNVFIYIISFLLFLICGAVIYFLTIYGTAFVVKKKKSVFQSLRASYELFRQNLAVNLEMALILFVFNILFFFATLLVGFIISSPFFVLYFLCLISAENPQQFWKLVVVLLL